MLKWTRITETNRPQDGYRTEGAEITDNGNGFGAAAGSGRWAVMIAGKWVANVDTLAQAKQMVAERLS